MCPTFPAEQSQSEPNIERKNISFLRICADVTILLLLGIPTFYLRLFGSPYRRGYICNDQSLQYPYLEYSIATLQIAIFGSALSLTIVILCEIMIAFFWESRSRKSSLPRHQIKYSICNINVHFIWIRLYKYAEYFGLGSFAGLLLMDVTKFFTGVHRPHFFDVCHPKPIGVPDCSENEFHRYIDQYECTNTNYSPFLVMDAHMSFYSGHAAFAFYMAVYVVLYLQARVHPYISKYSPMFLPLLQFLLIVLATYISFSNFTDNKHHATDIFCGIVVGNLFAVIICVYLMKLFAAD
uniref:Phosphatidic acid phosphatase type 2/haloperoxidase domain-containing protein n=1 Tax=Plectus sambesii TaxID=2011161 RepID=A0A914UIT1_9BILA